MPLESAFDQEAHERDGRWFPMPAKVGGEFYGIWPGSVSDAYRRRLEKHVERWRREHDKAAKDKHGAYVEQVPDSVFGEAVGLSMAGLTVTKIRGVLYEGKELESTPANLRLVLSSSLVRGHCNDLLHNRDNYSLPAEEPEYLPETVEDTEGNSPGASISTSLATVSLTPSED